MTEALFEPSRTREPRSSPRPVPAERGAKRFRAVYVSNRSLITVCACVRACVLARVRACAAGNHTSARAGSAHTRLFVRTPLQACECVRKDCACTCARACVRSVRGSVFVLEGLVHAAARMEARLDSEQVLADGGQRWDD